LALFVITIYFKFIKKYLCNYFQYKKKHNVMSFYEYAYLFIK